MSLTVEDMLKRLEKAKARSERTHYTQRPDFVPATMQPHRTPRELTYRVASLRGPIGEEVFPNAWEALAWGHEHHRPGLWWAECEVGGENVNKESENVNDQNIPTA